MVRVSCVCSAWAVSREEATLIAAGAANCRGESATAICSAAPKHQRMDSKLIISFIGRIQFLSHRRALDE